MPEEPASQATETNGSGTFTLKAFGFEIKLTGRLARQVLTAAGLAVVSWYAAFSKPQLILVELKGLRTDVIKTQVMAGAIVDSLPATQKARAQRTIDERMAVLELAVAHP